MTQRPPWATLSAGADHPPPPLREGTSPCRGCAAACCWVLQVYSLVPSTMADLDFIQFALGFEGLEAGVDRAGQWVLNFRAPCRHLTEGFGCELHGSPHKPAICVRYDESKCLYRHAFLGPTGPDYLRLDLRRLRAIRDAVRFDGDGAVTQVPSREALYALALAADAAADVEPSPSPAPPKALEGGASWDPAARRPTGWLPPPGTVDRGWAEAAESPCERCAAPCCQVLVFDFGTPAHASAVDFMEYMLGFDGVELALTDQGWKTVLHTRCRYFDADTTRCGLFGHPERPRICSSYDAFKCAYRPWLMWPPRRPFLRVDHDAFQVVRRHFPLDPSGEVMVDLSLDQLAAVLGAMGALPAPPPTASAAPHRAGAR